MATATARKAPETGIQLERNLTFQLRMDEEKKDSFVFSWSSEYPVDYHWFKEILSHEEGAIDLHRLSGMNLLWNHDRDIVLGKIDRVWVENKKAYCEARWSKKASVQEYRQDVEDGILTNASFLYTVEKYEEMKGEDEDDLTFLGTRWTPYEISIVSVPADPTVGVGRSLSGFRLEKSETPGGLQVSETAVLEAKLEARQEETTRVREIGAMGRKHNLNELAESLIDAGTSIDEARRQFLEKIGTGEQKPAARSIDTSLNLKPNDEQEYSIRKAILAAAYGRDSEKGREAGREWEYSDEIAKKLEKPKSEKSIFIPVRDLKVIPSSQQRNSLVAGNNQYGGFTIDTELRAQDFITLLRNQAMVMRLGATLLTGLSGPVNIPRQASAGQTYWLGEEESITRSRIGFNQVGLRYKTIAGRQAYTRDLMYQSSIDVEMWIREDLAQILALGIDKAALFGTGTNNEPRGIANTPGVNSIALGTNGGELTWEDVVDVIKLVKKNNAAIGPINWLTNAEVEAKLMKTPKQSAGVEGNFILSEPGMMPMPRLCGYPFYTSEQIPSDLEKGTGENLSALIAGVFSQVVIGQWGVLEIEANPFSDEVWPIGSIDVRAMQSADVTLRHEESFTVISDIITV